MSDAHQPNPELVFNLINSYQQTAALRGAVEIGLFEALGKGLSSVREIASYCKGTERGVRILCDYLTVLGLITKQKDKYSHTPTSAAFLDPQSPACIAKTIDLLNDPQVMGMYDHLAGIVREGYDSMPHGGTVEPENPIWVEFAHSMVPMMAPMAAPLGEVVLSGDMSVKRVLDIAAGHGLFGIEVAKRCPEAELVALDWEQVLEVARSNAEQAGVGSRFTPLAGSAFEVDFGEPYDIILLTNFLHHFDVEANEALLRKCYAALKPGGRVAALEFVPNDDRVTPTIPASFALIMLATTPSGDAYTFAEYEQMFLRSGFARTKPFEVQVGPHTIVLGYKD